MGYLKEKAKVCVFGMRRIIYVKVEREGGIGIFLQFF